MYLLGVGLEDLKYQIIETLKYPRYLIRNELEIEDCPHNGRYDATDSACQECIDGEDCKWLLGSDEKSQLNDRALDQLVHSLEFAIESIESLMSSGEHDPLCHCDTCLWRRKADDLYGEVRCHPELPPPPMPH